MRIEHRRCDWCRAEIYPAKDKYHSISIHTSDEKFYEGKTSMTPMTMPSPTGWMSGAKVLGFDLCEKCFEGIQWNIPEEVVEEK